MRIIEFPDTVKVPFTKGDAEFELSLESLESEDIIALFVHGVKQKCNDATSGKKGSEALKAFKDAFKKMERGEVRLGGGGGRRLSETELAWKEAWGLALREIASNLGEKLTEVNAVISKRNEEGAVALLGRYVKKAVEANGCPERYQEILERNVERIDALQAELEKKYEKKDVSDVLGI